MIMRQDHPSAGFCSGGGTAEAGADTERVTRDTMAPNTRPVRLSANPLTEERLDDDMED
jgi:hypothetical protein